MAKNRTTMSPSLIELKDYDAFIEGASLKRMEKKIENIRKSAIFYLIYGKKKISSMGNKPSSQDIDVFTEFTNGKSLEEISQKFNKKPSRCEQTVREMGIFCINRYKQTQILKGLFILGAISLLTNFILIQIQPQINDIGQFISIGILICCSVFISFRRDYILSFRFQITKDSIYLTAILELCFFLILVIYPPFLFNEPPKLSTVPWYEVGFIIMQYGTNNAIVIFQSIYLYWLIQNWIFILTWVYTAWSNSQSKLPVMYNPTRLRFELLNGSLINAVPDTIYISNDIISARTNHIITEFNRADIKYIVRREWNEENFEYVCNEIWKKNPDIQVKDEVDLKEVLLPEVLKGPGNQLLEILTNLSDSASTRKNVQEIRSSIDRKKLENLRSEITQSLKSQKFVREFTKLFEYLDNSDAYRLSSWRKFVGESCRRVSEAYNLALTNPKKGERKKNVIIMIVLIASLLLSVPLGEAVVTAVIGAIATLVSAIISKK